MTSLASPPGNPLDAAPVSHSQFGEDRIVWEFFGCRTDGVFFEAGAHHPVYLSQTYLLEQKGWRGVLVEPMTDAVEDFKTLRPQSQLFHCALGSPEQEGSELEFVIPEGLSAEARLLGSDEKRNAHDQYFTVPVTTISSVLERAKVERIDYFSLDLEGYELPALTGFDFTRWSPSLILIEDHLHDLRVHRYLKAKGYKLVYRLGCNDWYVLRGTEFPLRTLQMRWELFRKLYLSMPFRKLRVGLKRIRRRCS